MVEAEQCPNFFVIIAMNELCLRKSSISYSDAAEKVACSPLHMAFQSRISILLGVLTQVRKIVSGVVIRLILARD